jgi:hypothetical protein
VPSRFAAALAVALALGAGSTEAQGSTRPTTAPEIPVLRLAIGPRGFEPARLLAPLGAFRISVESLEGDHCFAVPSLDVEKRVRAGRPVTVDLTIEKASEIPFNCCVDATETGVLVVGKPRTSGAGNSPRD